LSGARTGTTMSLSYEFVVTISSEFVVTTGLRGRTVGADVAAGP
jgi:hypothetical protein